MGSELEGGEVGFVDFAETEGVGDEALRPSTLIKSSSSRQQ